MLCYAIVYCTILYLTTGMSWMYDYSGVANHVLSSAQFWLSFVSTA